MKDYEDYDAVGLADLVRAGKVSPSELVEAAIERIEKRNPSLNAVVTKIYERARRCAADEMPEGPFRGVPFLLKDLFINLAGVPTSNGCPFFDGYIPGHNTEVVNRLEAAGFVFVGKTNTPELGLGITTESERLGSACNPWDLSKTTGGSSGGSAAAVAAGMVPAAGASDGGGSIRIPASRCGLFGLKPTRGRTPSGPDVGEYYAGQGVEHAVTRSVRDSAAILDVLAGPDLGAPYAAAPQSPPFLKAVHADPGRLRIAFFAEPLLCGAATPEVAAALNSTVELLTDLGHELIEARPEIDGAEFTNAFCEVTAGATAADIERFSAALGRKPRARDFETETWALIRLGQKLTAREYALSLELLRMTGRNIARFMEEKKVQLMLCPTMPDPPFDLGATRTPLSVRFAQKVVVGWFGLSAALHRTAASRKAVLDAFSAVPYTPVFNATGQPAMSVPLCWSEDNLPIGMMFSAGFGQEALLLRLAGQLEKARPWWGKRPTGFSDR